MQGNAFSRWFWRKRKNSRMARKLRFRLMTMVLALVLPVSIICMVISVFSAVEARELGEMNNRNAFAMYLGKIELRYELEHVDMSQAFPDRVASDLAPLLATVEGFDGFVYIGNADATYLMSTEGVQRSDQKMEELSRRAHTYLWRAEDDSFAVLTVFPYDLSLSYLPIWFWIGMGIAVLSVVACPLLYRQLRLDVLVPMGTLGTALEEIKKDRGYRIPPQSGRDSDEFLELFDAFNAMAEEAQESYEKDVRLLETEMDNLRLQVNPHMLLNSYNMIYALAESKNYPVIQDYTLCLVDYFRYVLRRGNNLVSVGQELEFVDNFIRMQRIRFPGRFSYVYQVEEDCREAQIPPLLIENFVENAIKYALEPGQAIEIMVAVRRDVNQNGREALHIAITDTGSGIRPEVLEKLKAHQPYIDEAGHRHIGIYNCLRRIELFYGEEGDVHFSSGERKGTQIYLVVPFMTEDKMEGREG